MFGVIVRGLCKGTRREQRGKFITELVGLALRRHDGYGGFQDELIEIEIPKARLQSGVLDVLQGHVGQVIEIPVWIKPWSNKRGLPCISYIMSNEGDIVKCQGGRSSTAGKPPAGGAAVSTAATGS